MVYQGQKTFSDVCLDSFVEGWVEPDYFSPFLFGLWCSVLLLFCLFVFYVCQFVLVTTLVKCMLLLMYRFRELLLVACNCVQSCFD